MKYNKKDIDDALQLLKQALTEIQDKELIQAVQVATDCMEVVKEDKWIDAQESLPEKQGSRRYVSCNVILVHSMNDMHFFEDEPPGQLEREFVCSARFDTEQKIWCVDVDEYSGTLYLNALVDPESLPIDCDFVSYWMYMPSIE